MSLEQQAAGQRPPTAPPTKFKWTDDTSVMLLEEVENNEKTFKIACIVSAVVAS